MLAMLADAPLEDPSLVYEPKYDGIRAIVEVTLDADSAGGTGRAGRAGRAGKAGGAGRDAVGRAVRIWSRNGNEKTTQFPEIVEALQRWAAGRREAVPDRLVLDGEIVALDSRGQPLGFQALQGRIHVVRHGHVVAPPSRRTASGSRRGASANAAPARVPVAFIAFDLLREGDTDLRGRPLIERRARLEVLLPPTRRVSTKAVLRLSEIVRGDGRALHARAVEQGWEGVIAKRADSIYHSGKRTPDWRKIKITHEQEFVIGGWTDPRGTRSGFGSLVLGVWEEMPASGSGRRASREQRQLRYVGHVGTGFDGREIDRLMALFRPLGCPDNPFSDKPPTNERPHWIEPKLVAQVRFTEWTDEGILRHPVYLGLRDDKKAKEVVRELKPVARSPKPVARSLKPDRAEQDRLNAQLQALEDARQNGYLQLPDGQELSVTNLHKVFWPQGKRTKGDLFRYYVEAAPFLLPALADRPLVMKRFPNGIAAQPFYQHRVPEAPEGVRIEVVEDDERRPQLIGGDLLTLMHTTQLAAISQDPWFSRQGSLEFADHTALDLDPMPGVPFERVLDVARWLRDELGALGATGVPKTSGSDGLHIYIPLPPETPYEAGMIFCQIVATIVATRHPGHATTERMVKARPKTTVYVDCLQNIMGKTLASAYSARASEWAGVSTPLSWDEVDAGVRKEDFTIDTVPGRLKTVGDLWKPLRTSKGVDLERAAAKAARRMRT